MRRKRLLGGRVTDGNKAAGGTKHYSKTLSLKFQKNCNYTNRSEENPFVKVTGLV